MRKLGRSLLSLLMVLWIGLVLAVMIFMAVAFVVDLTGVIS